VKAAIEDEAAVAKLAQTMTNLGLAHDTAQVEASIASMETELGIVDMELRPAYDRLVRSIGDTDDAMKAMSLAADISAGTGKSLDAVVQALGRAYDGNTQGLSRLGAGLSSTLLKSGDMKAITEQLATTFGGQATTKAQTYEGQIKRLSLEFDNLKEAFGRGFITGLGDANDSTDELMATLKELEPELEKLGSTLADVAIGGVKAASGLVDFNDNVGKASDFAVARFSISLIRNADALGIISDEAGAAAEAEYQLYLANAGLIGQMDPLARGLYAAELRWKGYADATRDAQLASSNFALTTGELRKVISPTVAAAIAAGKTTATYGGKLTDLRRKAEPRQQAGSPRKPTSSRPRSTCSAASSTNCRAHSTAKSPTLSRDAGRQGLLDHARERSSSAASTSAPHSKPAPTSGSRRSTRSTGRLPRRMVRQRPVVDQGAAAQTNAHRPAGVPRPGSRWRTGAGNARQGPSADVQRPPGRRRRRRQHDRSGNGPRIPHVAGIDSAEDFVDGTIEQLLKEQDRLKAIGKNVGKGIGVNIKAEIAQGGRRGRRAAQAAKTAAAAERASEIAAQQVVVSEQQIAQALQRLISNSNARAGYSMGIPVPTPVLG
jgi:hypothetical protein